MAAPEQVLVAQVILCVVGVMVKAGGCVMAMVRVLTQVALVAASFTITV